MDSELQVFQNCQNENQNLINAINEMQKSDWQKAFEDLQIASHSNNTSLVNTLLGICCLKKNDRENAESFFEKATKIEPVNCASFFYLGNIYFIDQKLTDAIKYYIEALILNPRYSKATLNLAIAFKKLGLFNQAVKYYERFLKFHSNIEDEDYIDVKYKINKMQRTCQDYAKKAHSCVQHGDIQNAAKYYASALKHYPNQSKVAINLANIFFADKNYEKAIHYFQIAISILGHSQPFLYKLAFCYDSLKQYSYAYCNYNLFLNSLKTSSAVNAITERMLKLSRLIENDEKIIVQHLEKAQQYNQEAKFELALTEYKYYYILRHYSDEDTLSKIKELERILQPELIFIKNEFKHLENYLVESNYIEAQGCCDRILFIAKPNSADYNRAKKYKQRVVMEKFNAKKT